MRAAMTTPIEVPGCPAAMPMRPASGEDGEEPQPVAHRGHGLGRPQPEEGRRAEDPGLEVGPLAVVVALPGARSFANSPEGSLDVAVGRSIRSRP